MSKRSRRRARLRYRREVERMLRPAALRYTVKKFVRGAEVLAKGLNEMMKQVEKMMDAVRNMNKREEKSNAG